MCVVLDCNIISSVFNPSEKDHEEFKPVLHWITSGNGKMVFGGSKYKKELNRMKSYLKFIKELSKAGKCINVDDSAVDKIQNEIKNKHRDFNDYHIVAIIIVSKVRIICTKDKKAIPWFKNSDLYPSDVKKPKIYTSKRNRNLLNRRKYIGNVCL